MTQPTRTPAPASTPQPNPGAPKRKVLLTGGGGRIGTAIVEPMKALYDLRLLDRQPVFGDSATILGDLQDRAVLEQAMAGVDTVIHLAATSDEAPFLDELVPNNVVGLYNVFEAARTQKVKRLVFASSCQAVLGYSIETTITADMPHRPVSLYGATKALGEVIGRYYHDKHGLEFVALRIGSFHSYAQCSTIFTDPDKPREAGRALWISPKDILQVLLCAVERPDVGYVVAGATSKSKREWLSLKEAREQLGYEPVDDIDLLYPRA